MSSRIRSGRRSGPRARRTWIRRVPVSRSWPACAAGFRRPAVRRARCAARCAVRPGTSRTGRPRSAGMTAIRGPGPCSHSSLPDRPVSGRDRAGRPYWAGLTWWCLSPAVARSHCPPVGLLPGAEPAAVLAHLGRGAARRSDTPQAAPVRLPVPRGQLAPVSLDLQHCEAGSSRCRPMPAGQDRRQDMRTQTPAELAPAPPASPVHQHGIAAGNPNSTAGHEADTDREAVPGTDCAAQPAKPLAQATYRRVWIPTDLVGIHTPGCAECSVRTLSRWRPGSAAAEPQPAAAAGDAAGDGEEPTPRPALRPRPQAESHPDNASLAVARPGDRTRPVKPLYLRSGVDRAAVRRGMSESGS